MDNREAIIQATKALILEKGEQLNDITVREISKKAGVGLGLINYHFENKDKLIALCIESMVNDISGSFSTIRSNTSNLTPFEALEFLGSTTLTFLFEHLAISKNSILTDLYSPKENDNTNKTYQTYIPIVAACRPDWDISTVMRKTCTLIAALQYMVLRYEEIKNVQGIDLKNKDKREKYHTQLLHDILEV